MPLHCEEWSVLTDEILYIVFQIMNTISREFWKMPVISKNWYESPKWEKAVYINISNHYMVGEEQLFHSR